MLDMFWLDTGLGMFAFDKEYVLGLCSSTTLDDLGVVMLVGFPFVDIKLFYIKDVILAFLLGFWLNNAWSLINFFKLNTKLSSLSALSDSFMMV